MNTISDPTMRYITDQLINNDVVTDQEMLEDFAVGIPMIDAIKIVKSLRPKCLLSEFSTVDEIREAIAEIK